MRDIRLASNRSQFISVWVKYDEQYRLKRQITVLLHGRGGGVFDSELWLICLTNNQKDNPTQRERNRKHLGSISLTGTSMMYCP